MKRLPVLAAVFLLVTGVLMAEPPDEAMTVKSTEGLVEYRAGRSGGWSSVEKGDALKEGDYVRTGTEGRVALAMGDAAYVELDPESHVGITTLIREEEEGRGGRDDVTTNKVRIKQIKGRIKNSLPKHKQPTTQYNIEGPSAVTGVRGTVFECSTSLSKRFQCAVLTGALNFAPTDGAKPKVVRGGSLVAYDSSMGEPRQSDLDAATIRRLRQFGRTANRYYRKRDVKTRPLDSVAEPSNEAAGKADTDGEPDITITIPETLVRKALEKRLKQFTDDDGGFKDSQLAPSATLSSVQSFELQDRRINEEPLDGLYRVRVQMSVTATFKQDKKTITETVPLSFAFHARR